MFDIYGAYMGILRVTGSVGGEPSIILNLGLAQFSNVNGPVGLLSVGSFTGELSRQIFSQNYLLTISPQHRLLPSGLRSCLTRHSHWYQFH
jgi:hypothetical protein